MTVNELDVDAKPSWCPGCGNFAILNIMKEVIVKLRYEPHNVLIVSGIGQSSKLPHWINVYGFHTIHGRALPVAAGAKLANNKLNVIVIGGDGDGYSMGIGHMIHSMRRNIDITYIVHNNQVYGLTKGQTSPTSDFGFKSVSSPFGSIEYPVNPITTAISAGATYVSRANAFEKDRAVEIISNAILHKGFAFVDLIQYCITYNKVNTPRWFKERAYYLNEENYNFSDKINAFDKGLEWGDKIPFGLFYKEIKPTYEDHLQQIAEKPLVKHNILNIEADELFKNLC